MRSYDVYFEVYGKKLKTKVLAESEEAAKQKVLSDITFHKVVKQEEAFNQTMDMLEDILNDLTKFK